MRLDELSITIRPMCEGDNLNQVARLIYLTDPYVYPNWFDSIEDGIKVIKQMIMLPTLYNKENITVAVTDSGFIVGVVVSKQAPFVEKIEDVYLAFEKAGVKRDDRTKQTFDAYYAKMGIEEDGYYLANIAVEKEYRKKGIGTALTKYVMKGKHYCTLECVIANEGAWRVYQSLGFEIAYEYPGVHDVPCYKMFYERKGD